MNNVVKTKLCWSSKNKDLHACNALSFSVFILFLASSLFPVRMSLLNVASVCVSVHECVYKYDESGDTPQCAVLISTSLALILPQIVTNSAFCISAITGKKMNMNNINYWQSTKCKGIFSKFSLTILEWITLHYMIILRWIR